MKKTLYLITILAVLSLFFLYESMHFHCFIFFCDSAYILSMQK